MMLFKNIKDALNNRTQVTGLKLTLTKPELTYELSTFPELNQLFISGKKPIEIPDWFKELKKLKSLTVHCPIKKIAPELFYLEALEFLDMSQCEMKEFIIAQRVTAPLKNLNLAHNALKEIPAGVERMETLESMYLNNNKISRLSSSLTQMPKLKRLYLDQNQLTQLPPFLKEMQALNILSIDNNPFSEEEKQRIQQVFKVWFE